MLHLLLILQAAPPTMTSGATINGKEFCYNYYYNNEESLPALVNLELLTANKSCYTTVLLSTSQLIGFQLNLNVSEENIHFALVAEVSTAIFQSLNLHIKGYKSPTELLQNYTFSLVVGGMILTLEDSTIKMTKGGNLMATTPAGLESFLVKNTQLTDYALLKQFMAHCDGFAEQLKVSLQLGNGDQRTNLGNFKLTCGTGDELYVCDSCKVGEIFDDYSRKCISEITPNMDCDECGVGFIRGRSEHSKGCYERTSSFLGGKDCYYYIKDGALDTSCL